MIVFAHLGHWYSAFGFLVPAALVIAWIRYQARRDRRQVRFAEDWTIVLRDGSWHLESVTRATPQRRRGPAARAQLVPSPWMATGSESESAAAPPRPAADRSTS